MSTATLFLCFSDAQWADAEKLLKILGFAVALVGAGLGLMTYLKSRNEAAKAHMHGLFKDYLRVRIDLSKAGAPTEWHANLLSQCISFKLYTLEEAWEWLSRRTTFSLSWDAKRAWRATIKSHLLEDPGETYEMMLLDVDCYSLTFLEIAYEVARYPEAGWIKPSQERVDELASAILRIKSQGRA